MADEEVEDAAVDGDPFDQIMDYSTGKQSYYSQQMLHDLSISTRLILL